MKLFKYMLLAVLTASSFQVKAQYKEDVLGNGYLSRTIEQGKDYEGRVVCTVIKKEAATPSKKAIVYVHGYNDYFFQSALGDSANAHGYNFYAVDLRKYGRSLLPHQDAFYCKKMDEYIKDIDTTIAIARQEGNDYIVLMGHSTGGLTTPYYLKATKNKAKVDALVLNSPFLDWNMSWFLEHIGVPCVSVAGIFFKRWEVMGEEKDVRGYACSLLKSYKGEWEFNTDWKMPKGHPKRAGWIRAINRGQKKLRRKAKLDIPVLVMSSDTTINESAAWNEGFRRADVVLDVKDIAKKSKKLSKKLTYTIIPGGKHDLILSEKDARDNAYRTTFEWLEKK